MVAGVGYHEQYGYTNVLYGIVAIAVEEKTGA
jgi:hypothetical protein